MPEHDAKAGDGEAGAGNGHGREAAVEDVFLHEQERAVGGAAHLFPAPEGVAGLDGVRGAAAGGEVGEHVVKEGDVVAEGHRHAFAGKARVGRGEQVGIVGGDRQQARAKTRVVDEVSDAGILEDQHGHVERGVAGALIARRFQPRAARADRHQDVRAHQPPAELEPFRLPGMPRA